MMSIKNITLIVLAVLVFGLLIGFRAGLVFGWQRALIAAVAVGGLGWLLSLRMSRGKK